MWLNILGMIGRKEEKKKRKREEKKKIFLSIFLSSPSQLNMTEDNLTLFGNQKRS